MPVIPKTNVATSWPALMPAAKICLQTYFTKNPELLLEIDLSKFVWPLARLLLGLACGLLLANLLEALRWTDRLARLAAPLARLAHLGPVSAGAFALAFVSPASANALLSEKLEAGAIDAKELLLSNLFNGLPAWLAHTPTILLLLWPALGFAAVYYVGATLFAALARTLFTIFLARQTLSPRPALTTAPQKNLKVKFGARLYGALLKAFARFKKRAPRMLLMTTFVYGLMQFCQSLGYFSLMESWLADRLDWLAVVKPQAMGIIVLQLLAEMGATIGAAGAALEDASLTPADVVIAMLVGNVIATPLRAIRHQLPAYAGFFRPALAVKLVIANQSLRAVSMIAAIFVYVLIYK